MKIKNIFKILICLVLLSSCASKKNNFSNNANKTSLKTKKNSLDDFANVLGVTKKDLENEKLYFYIDDWLGSPHKLGGTSKTGIDCSGFVKNVYQEIYDKNLPRTSQDMADITKDKKLKNLKEGDLVFFAFGGKRIDHVGIYLHNNKFVHVSTKKGVMISNLDEIWYSKYFVKSGTIK